MFTTPGKSNSNDEESSKTQGWFSRLFSSQKVEEEKKEKESETPSTIVKSRKSTSPHHAMERLDLQMPHETHIAPPKDSKPPAAAAVGYETQPKAGTMPNGISPWKPRAMNDKIVRQSHLVKFVNEPLADTREKQPQRWMDMGAIEDEKNNSSLQIANRSTNSLPLANSTRTVPRRKYSARKAKSIAPSVRRSYLYEVPSRPEPKQSVTTSSIRHESEFASLLNVYAKTNPTKHSSSRQQYFRKNSLSLTPYSRIIKAPGENKRTAEKDAEYSASESSRSAKKARVTFESPKSATSGVTFESPKSAKSVRPEAAVYRQLAENLSAQVKDLMSKANAIDGVSATRLEEMEVETRPQSSRVLQAQPYKYNMVEDETYPFHECFDLMTGTLEQIDGFTLDPAILQAEEEELANYKIAAVEKEEIRKKMHSTDDDDAVAEAASTSHEIQNSEGASSGWGGTAIAGYLSANDKWFCEKCRVQNSFDRNTCEACTWPRFAEQSSKTADAAAPNKDISSGQPDLNISKQGPFTFGENGKAGFSFGANASSSNSIGISQTKESGSQVGAPAEKVSFSFGVPSKTNEQAAPAPAPAPTSTMFSFSVPPKENIGTNSMPASGGAKFSFGVESAVQVKEDNNVRNSVASLVGETDKVPSRPTGEFRNGDATSTKASFQFGGSISHVPDEKEKAGNLFGFGSGWKTEQQTSANGVPPSELNAGIASTKQVPEPSLSVTPSAPFRFGSQSHEDTNLTAQTPKPPFQFGQPTSMSAFAKEHVGHHEFPPTDAVDTSKQISRKKRDLNDEDSMVDSSNIPGKNSLLQPGPSIAVVPLAKSSAENEIAPFRFGGSSSGTFAPDSSKLPSNTNIAAAPSNSLSNQAPSAPFTFGKSSILPSTTPSTSFGVSMSSGGTSAIAMTSAGNTPQFGGLTPAVNVEPAKTPAFSFGANTTVSGITPQFGGSVPSVNAESSLKTGGFTFGASNIQNRSALSSSSGPFSAGSQAPVSTGFQFGQQAGTSGSFGGFGSSTNKSESFAFGNTPAPAATFAPSATSTLGTGFPPAFGGTKSSDSAAGPFGMPPAMSSGIGSGGPVFGASTSGGSFGPSGFAAPSNPATSQLDSSGGFQMGTGAPPKQRRIVRARRPR